MANPFEEQIIEEETVTSGPTKMNEQPSQFENDPTKGFSFDNIAPSKWREKISEMHAWCTTELLRDYYADGCGKIRCKVSWMTSTNGG